MTAQQLKPGGFVHNRYRIEQSIGSGGFGAVYKALDTRLNAHVVLKQNIVGSPAHVEAAHKAFKREAELLANLLHPSLPKVMDHFVERDHHYLVMAFIPGDNLYEQLVQRKNNGQGPFPIDSVLLWLDQLFDALEYLHGQKYPIIHRDIKPANIKVTPNGQLYLLDFGLAKGAMDDQPLIGSDQLESLFVAFTPNYASIEQYLGKPTTPESDIYSLSATAFHLLTGTPPAPAKARRDQRYKVPGDPVSAKLLLDRNVPGPLAEVIVKGLGIEPSERFGSIGEMRAALRKSLRPGDPLGQMLADRDGIRLRKEIDKERQLRTKAEQERTQAQATVQSMQRDVADSVRTVATLRQELKQNALMRTLQGLLLLAAIGGGGYWIYNLNNDMERQRRVARNEQELVRHTAIAAQQTAVPAQTAVVAAQTTVAEFAARERAIYDSLATRYVNVPQVPPLAHVPDDGSLATAAVQVPEYAPCPTPGPLTKCFRQIEDYSNAQLADFALALEVLPPWSDQASLWDIVVLFRDTGTSQEYRLVLESDGAWDARYYAGDVSNSQVKARGNVGPLSATEPTAIKLYVRNGDALFYVNDRYAGRFDISEKDGAGNISLGVGGNGRTERQGAMTTVQNLTLASLP